MLNPLCSFYLLGVPSTRKSPIAVIIKDLHPSFLPFVTPSPTLYSTDALFKHSRDCLYLVKPDNCFKAKLERWLNFASVLHFRKWSIEQPGLLVFSAKSKSLKPLVLSFTLKGLLTWKEVLCECAVMDKNVEKWNMEMGIEDVFPGGWWNMQRKLLKIKNEKKVGGKKNYLSKFFFSSFFGRRCMYSKHMYNTVESRSPLSKPFQNFTQPSSVLFLLHFPPSRTFHFKCLVHGNAFKHVWVLVILFENYPKCLISANLCPIDLSGSSVWPFVNVARFARNDEWDFSYDF